MTILRSMALDYVMMSSNFNIANNRGIPIDPICNQNRFQMTALTCSFALYIHELSPRELWLDLTVDLTLRDLWLTNSYPVDGESFQDEM